MVGWEGAGAGRRADVRNHCRGFGMSKFRLELVKGLKSWGFCVFSFCGTKQLVSGSKIFVSFCSS